MCVIIPICIMNCNNYNELILVSVNSSLKDSLQWKNDLGLYFSLVLVMKIGMCDLVIFCLD